MKLLPFLLMICLFPGVLLGQKFFPAADLFSHQKPSYVTLQNGTEIEGELKKLKRKKGLIQYIKLELSNGDKKKIEAREIDFMYLPKSGFQKFADAYEFIHDARAWEDESIEQEYIEQGYIYFEQSKVDLKRSTETLLLQLLNPSFCSHIRVYQDPRSAETTSFGVGGITVAGGDEKSYYVKKGEENAYRLKKKEYKDQFSSLFDNCKSLQQKYAEDINWIDFAEHIDFYGENCAGDQ